jgi:hypothetical protein
MQLVTEFLVAAAVVAVGVPTGRMINSKPVPVEPAVAMVRFTNSMTTNASLSSNGTMLFADVASTRTTGWAQVSDSVVNFTLTVSGQEGQTAALSHKLMDGGQYTVTAAPGTDGKPALTIKHEEKSVPPDTTKG